MFPMHHARPTFAPELPSLGEVVALQNEVARLRGLLATILKSLPEDQHGQRIRLLNALSELQIFERAFVDRAPRYADTPHDRLNHQHSKDGFASRYDGKTGVPMLAALDKMKRQVSQVVEECETLRRAFKTEQQCHQETLAEITLAWGELSAILDREERKTAALAAERDELREALWTQGPTGASPRPRGRRDELAMALQECEAAISRLEAERDALVTALEAQKADAVGALKDYESRIATVQSERDAVSQALAKQKADAEQAASQATKERQTLAQDLQAAQANVEQLTTERDRLSSSLDTVNKDLVSTGQALELSKKLVSYQNSTIDKHVKKLKEHESSLAVAGILKNQVSNEVTTLTARCAQLSMTLGTTQAAKALKEADLADAQKQLALEQAAVRDIQAKLVVEQENSNALKTRLSKMEETLKDATVSPSTQEPELETMRAERDECARREQDAVDALERERGERMRIEKERNVLKAELNTVKAMLIDFSVAAQQSASRSSSRENVAAVFGQGASVNIPKSLSMSSSKSSSRFGSPNKVAGGQNVS